MLKKLWRRIQAVPEAPPASAAPSGDHGSAPTSASEPAHQEPPRAQTLAELESEMEAARFRYRQLIEAWVDRVGTSFTPWAPHIPSHLLTSARLVESRILLLGHMPKRGVVVEVGTQTGNFARQIIQDTDPVELHLIDCDYSNFNRAELEDRIAQGSVRLHEGFSQTVLETFPDNYFDWMYVDADHSLDGIRRDIAIGAPKVKPGGYMVFNDYTVWSPGEVWPYGVLFAVNEFAIRENWPVAFFAFHGQGYHDIAFRRPL